MALTSPTVARDRPLALDDVGAAPSVSGLNVTEEAGAGITRQTVIRFESMRLAMTDAGASGSQGSQQIYAFPRGVIHVEAVVAALTFTRVGTAISASGTVAVGVGSSVLSVHTAFADPEANMAEGTAILASGTGLATINNLSGYAAQTVDSTGGTADADGELTDVGAAFSQAAINNNLATLASIINRIIVTPGNTRSPLLDGVAAAKSAYLNAIVPDAGSSGNDAFTVTGTLVITWKNLGGV